MTDASAYDFDAEADTDWWTAEVDAELERIGELLEDAAASGVLYEAEFIPLRKELWRAGMRAAHILAADFVKQPDVWVQLGEVEQSRFLDLFGRVGVELVVVDETAPSRGLIARMPAFGAGREPEREYFTRPLQHHFSGKAWYVPLDQRSRLVGLGDSLVLLGLLASSNWGVDPKTPDGNYGQWFQFDQRRAAALIGVRDRAVVRRMFEMLDGAGMIQYDPSGASGSRREAARYRVRRDLQAPCGGRPVYASLYYGGRMSALPTLAHRTVTVLSILDANIWNRGKYSDGLMELAANNTVTALAASDRVTAADQSGASTLAGRALRWGMPVRTLGRVRQGRRVIAPAEWARARPELKELMPLFFEVRTAGGLYTFRPNLVALRHQFPPELLNDPEARRALRANPANTPGP